VLFVLATVLAGRSVLPLAQDTDIYLAGLGILLTAVYITGLIFRPRRQVLGMGVDSLAVLVLYVSARLAWCWLPEAHELSDQDWPCTTVVSQAKDGGAFGRVASHH
jgi:CHASE2 domain-containing sensor protein